MRVLSRRDLVEPFWHDVAPDVVIGSLEDDAALVRLCAGAEVVVHAAGLVKARSRAAFEAVNIAGARRLAIAANNDAHVMLISSLSAREPELSHYSASKRGGEDALAEVLGQRLTIVRPCAIYGPGDRELLPVFQAASILPVLPLLSALGRVTMIHVEDAARQISALAARSPRGQTISLCDGRFGGYTWRELMVEAARASGRTVICAPVPPFLLKAIGITNDFMAVLGATPMLSSAKVRELLHPDWCLSESEGPAGLPAARYSLQAGFAETVRWYRAAGWMKH